MFDEATIKRFWSKVAVGELNECWEWQAYKTPAGYGDFGIGCEIERAHRVSWMISNNSGIPPGLVIRHLCNNPSCVNPAHLALGTHGDNVRDKVESGRQLRGSGVPSAKLTETDVHEIKKLLSAGVTHSEIGARFGVVRCNITAIANGKSWAWLEEEE